MILKMEERQIYFCEKCVSQCNDRLLYDVTQKLTYEKLKDKNLSLSSDIACNICKTKPRLKKKKVFIINYDKELLNTCNKTFDTNVEEVSKDISRHYNFGVKYRSQSVYVWFEALLAYINKYLKCKNVDVKYYFGADNYYFHTILYPQIIHPSLKKCFPTKNNIVCRKNLCNNNEKISNSLGNTLNITEFNCDVIRYTLTQKTPEKKDTNITYLDFKNSEKILKNRFYSTLDRIKKLKSCGGVIFEPSLCEQFEKIHNAFLQDKLSCALDNINIYLNRLNSCMEKKSISNNSLKYYGKILKSWLTCIVSQ